MPQATGSFSRIVIDKESSYAQLKDTTVRQASIVPFVNESLGKEQNLLESNTISASRNPQEPGLGNINVSGDITVELNPLAHGRLVYFTLGGYSVTYEDPDSSPGSGDEYYRHVFNVGSNIPSFLTEVRISDGASFNKYYWYLGCKVNQMSLRVTTEGYIETTFSITGSKSQVSTSEYASSFLSGFDHAAITSCDAVLKIGGNTVAVVTEMNFTYNNNLDENTFVIGQCGSRGSLPEGRVAVNGSLTMQFNEEAANYVDMAEASTETSLELTLARGAGDGTTGNEKIIFYFPEIKLQPPRIEVNGPQGLFVTMNFIAYASDSDSALVVEYWNQIADYSIG